MVTNASIEEICSTLRRLLEDAVERNLAEAMLLSGGLDTSILAVVASRFVPLKAFTVAFKGAPAPDVKYATLVANNLRLKHFVHCFGEDELYEVVPRVVEAMRSFDPVEIRNDVAIHVGLSIAMGEGFNAVMTGDGCDELFAGYSFFFELGKERLELELRRMWGSMGFSSITLAETLGMEARLPYLDPKLKSYAMALDSRHKVRSHKGRKWGKWILRRAFEGILPEEVVWRVKTPIESGSGTAILPSFFSRKIPDAEFEGERERILREEGVTIRDKEQLFYYEAYRSIIGVPHPTDPEGRVCPLCNSNVAERATHCRTCGAYPI